MSRKLHITIRSGGPASWAIRLVATALVVWLVLWVPSRASDSLIDTSTTACVWMSAAMSLNLLVGFTGQLSLGHSAFLGLGAYTTAIGVSRWGWSPLWTLPVAFAVAFVVGVVVSLPALRIKGVYLALVTLSLAMVFPNFIKWRKIEWLTQGARNITDVGYKFDKDNPTFEVFGWNPWGNLRGQNVKPLYYWLALIVVVFVYLVCRGIVKSRMGRSLIAIRDNSTAAAVMGVNLAVTKGIVFGLSAAMCALPGSVLAIKTGTVTPDTAMLTVSGSIVMLVIMVVGGSGSLWGPIVGAAVYQLIDEKTGEWADPDKIPGVLRPFLGWADLPPSMGIFAVALIGLMFFAPHGIVGLWRQTVARFVTVVPKPAGTTNVTDLESAAVES